MRLAAPARAVILTGFMGTGKTVVGRCLAERLGRELVETDALIERAAGRGIPEVFSQEGETAFRDYETAAVREATVRPGVVISTGGGALLRPENVAALREAGPLALLQARPETILRRTAQCNYRPLLEGEDRPARIIRLLAERAEAYGQADWRVVTDDLSPEQVAQRVLQLMREDPRTTLWEGQPVRVPVPLEPDGYDVHVGPGLLARLGEIVPPPRPGGRAAVITSETLRAPYGERAAQALGEAGWAVSLHCVPQGEAAKRMVVAEQLCGELVEAGHDRASWVFAVGGGVICDLAGFVAAIFMRGIASVTAPTSLLAQVDASVGGKVAVNLPQGKNLAGAFHQPRAVVADTDCLRSLPASEWGEGLAEVVKHAALADAGLFGFLERELTRVPGGEPAALTYVVARNCQIKAQVVARDPAERGWRAVLNFGHTVGHALERAAGDWGLGHGEAVARGMRAEARWAQAQGLTPPGVAERLEALLAAAGLGAEALELDWEQARTALRADKKLQAGRLALPVLTRVGEVRLLEGVGLAQLEEALALARE